MSQRQWPIFATGIGGAAVGTRLWKQRGQIYATVVVKATLALVPDSAMALSSPDPLDADERAHPSGQGLCAGGDMAPTLAHAELWVIGHAEGVATSERRALDIRVALARDGAFIYEKRLSLGTGGAYGAPVRLPLGPLGPLSKHWPIRARRRGGLDAALLDGPRIELPERFDWEYFQTAPADQRLPALRGDEWLILDGVYLERPRLKTYLPRAMGVARLYGRDADLRAGRPLRIGLDSLHIDVDRRCCSVLWRGYFPISSQAVLESFHVVGGIEWPGHPLAWVNPFEGGPVEQKPVAPAPAADSPLEDTFIFTGADAEKLVHIAGTLLDGSPPDSEPCVDTVQLTDSDLRKLAKVAATPFEANVASLNPHRSEGTVQLSAIDEQMLAQIAATPFEAKKMGLPPRAPPPVVPAPANAERSAAPASADLDETLNIPETLGAKQVAAAVLPFVPRPPLASPPLVGTPVTAPIAPQPDPSPPVPPPLLGTLAPELEDAAAHAATPSPDAPATPGAFFLAAMERAAARRTA